MSEADKRSIPEVISAVAADLGDLVRKEVELVRIEIAEKFALVAKAGVAVSAGAVLLLGAFFSLLAAVIIALSYVMPAAWAALLVAVVAGLLGSTLLAGAVKRLKAGDLAPRRAADELRKDVNLLKEQVR